jgi:hypothetical protein
MKKSINLLFGVLIVLGMLLSACTAQATPVPTTEIQATVIDATAAPTLQPTTQHVSTELILATTTSTRDSGYWMPYCQFLKKNLG